MQTKIEVLRVPRSLQLYQNMSPTRYEGPEIYLTPTPKRLETLLLAALPPVTHKHLFVFWDPTMDLRIETTVGGKLRL